MRGFPKTNPSVRDVYTAYYDDETRDIAGAVYRQDIAFARLYLRGAMLTQSAVGVGAKIMTNSL